MIVNIKLDHLATIHTAIRRRLAENNLHDFVRQAWPIVEPDACYRDNWHVAAICDHLQAVTEQKISRLLINVPPGTMKSLLVCVFWPAWVWTTKPGKRFMFASYSDALTLRDSVRCRTILESPWFQKRWPLKLRVDQNTKGLFENQSGGWRLATSVGGRATGLHPDLVIADDANNASEAESDVERQNVIDWWDGAISTRGVSRGVGQVIIAQRLHASDLSGHVLTKGNWEHICLPMRYEPGRMKPTSLGWTDPRTKDGELLWPSLFSDDTVTQLENTMGAYFAAGQLYQRPAPRGGGLFKREWLTKLVTVRPTDITTTVRYWDKAGTSSGTGARTAGVLMGRRSNKRFIILDVITGRWQATEREEVIKSTAAADARRYPGTVIWVEQEPGSGGKESAQATVTNLAGYVCRIERVTGAKEIRAEPLASQASSGNVEILEASWTSEFISELCQFPTGKLKDQVDAASGAFNKLTEATGTWDRDSIMEAARRNSADKDGIGAPDPWGADDL